MDSRVQTLMVATGMAAVTLGGSIPGHAAEGRPRAEYETERKDVTGNLEWLARAVPETTDEARDSQLLRKLAAEAGIPTFEVEQAPASAVERIRTAEFLTEALTLQARGRAPWAAVGRFLAFDRHRLVGLARLEARSEGAAVAFTVRIHFMSQSAPLQAIPPDREGGPWDGVTEDEAMALRRDHALYTARIAGLRRLTSPEAPRASRSVLWNALADVPGLAVRELYLGGEATVEGIMARGTLDGLREAFDHAGFEVWDVTSVPFGACRRVTVVGAVRPHAVADGETAPGNLFVENLERECRSTADAQTGWVIDHAPKLEGHAGGDGAVANREALGLHLHDVDLADVFRVVESATGQGFVVDPDVRGRVSLDLEDATLDEVVGALGPAGLRVSGPGRIRRVSKGEGIPPVPPLERCRGLFGVDASFSWKGGDLRDVIALFADLSGLHFFAPPEVRGLVNLFVRETPSEQAFCAILASEALDFARDRDRMYVGTALALRGRAAARGSASFAAVASRDRPRVFPEERAASDYELVGTFSERGAWSALLATADGQVSVGEPGQALRSKVRVTSVGPDSAVLDSGGGPLTLKLAPPHVLSQKDAAGALGAQIEDGRRGSEPGAGTIARVSYVSPLGPAGEAGLRPGDVIRSLDGTPVANAARLRADLHERRTGDVVSMGIDRRGEPPATVNVRLVPARPLFQRACDAGEGWGCERLAALYEAGTTVEKDPLRAFALADKGCEAGNGRACFRLWRNFDRGTGAPSDPGAAIAALRRGCELGDLVACGRVAQAYEAGKVVTKDLPHAVSEYQRLCALGEGGSCGALGDLHEDGIGLPKDETPAAEFFRRACDLGAAFGCTSLGRLLRAGKGVAQDEARAAELFGQACAEDDPGGCRRLAGLKELGRGVAKNAPRAAELYRRACDLEDGPACTRLGRLHELGEGMPRDPARAAAFYERACRAGDTDGCVGLGATEASQGAAAPARTKRAKALFWQACREGNGAGCRSLGSAYEQEEATLPSAARLYGRACDAGDQGGCWRLGVLYRDGKGLEKNETRAASLFEKACTADDARGCSSLGLMHEFGSGVRRDEARAADLYRRACDLGIGFACAELGDLYGSGRGVALDQARHVALYRQACEGGFASACAEAGLRYANGDSVEADRSQGVALLRKGCSAGDALSCETLRPVGVER